MKVPQLSSGAAGLSANRQLMQPFPEESGSPGGHRRFELDALSLAEHGDFPKCDGGDGELIGGEGVIDSGSGLNSEPRVSRAEPQKNVGIEQDHFSDSQETSMGETTSPVMTRMPASRPNRVLGRSL